MLGGDEDGDDVVAQLAPHLAGALVVDVEDHVAAGGQAFSTGLRGVP